MSCVATLCCCQVLHNLPRRKKYERIPKTSPAIYLFYLTTWRNSNFTFRAMRRKLEVILNLHMEGLIEEDGLREAVTDRCEQWQWHGTRDCISRVEKTDVDLTTWIDREGQERPDRQSVSSRSHGVPQQSRGKLCMTFILMQSLDYFQGVQGDMSPQFLCCVDIG